MARLDHKLNVAREKRMAKYRTKSESNKIE